MMDELPKTSGPQFRADPLQEQPAVRMTIVGGRPPGSGQGLGSIPRGIEVLVRKATVDGEFRAALLAERAAAAARIGLELEPSEAWMLKAVPQSQLEAVIDRTRVPLEHRRAFLGNVAAAMLAALGVASGGCSDRSPPPTTGIAPDLPPAPESQPAGPAEPAAQNVPGGNGPGGYGMSDADDSSGMTGIRPDLRKGPPPPGASPAGIAPDLPPPNAPALPPPPAVPGGTGIRPGVS